MKETTMSAQYVLVQNTEVCYHQFIGAFNGLRLEEMKLLCNWDSDYEILPVEAFEIPKIFFTLTVFYEYYKNDGTVIARFLWGKSTADKEPVYRKMVYRGNDICSCEEQITHVYLPPQTDIYGCSEFIETLIPYVLADIQTRFGSKYNVGFGDACAQPIWQHFLYDHRLPNQLYSYIWDPKNPSELKLHETGRGILPSKYGVTEPKELPPVVALTLPLRKNYLMANGKTK